MNQTILRAGETLLSSDIDALRKLSESYVTRINRLVADRDALLEALKRVLNCQRRSGSDWLTDEQYQSRAAALAAIETAETEVGP